MNEKLKIGAAYIRVSTDGQLDYSPESQLDEIRKFARNNDILIDSQYIFVEQDGVSGKKAENRAAFQRMMATAKTKPKPFDVIIVWKFSRFARNQDESTFYKGTLRKKYGIDVMSVSEPIMDGMYGRLIETIIEWQDEFYSYNLSGEVHRGMKKKAELGGYNGKMPYGYIKKRDENPIVFEPEAAVVKEVFHMFVGGYDKPYICRQLNARNLKTKNGGKFTSSTIQYILTNPFYIGQIRWNVRKNSTLVIRPEEEWIVSQGTHEPIIDEEIFRLAQKKVKSNMALKRSYAKPVSRTKHYFSGLLKCPICGSTLTYMYRKDCHNNAFQCRGYKNGVHKESQYVTDQAVTTALIASLEDVVDNRNADYEIISQQKDAPSEEGLIVHELEKLKTRETRIKQAYLNGIDSLEEYRENKAAIQNYRTELESALANLQSSSIKEEIEDTFYKSVQSVLSIMKSDCDYCRKGTALRSIIKYIEHYKETDTYVFHYYAMKM